MPAKAEVAGKAVCKRGAHLRPEIGQNLLLDLVQQVLQIGKVDIKCAPVIPVFLCNAADGNADRCLLGPGPKGIDQRSSGLGGFFGLFVHGGPSITQQSRNICGLMIGSQGLYTGLYNTLLGNARRQERCLPCGLSASIALSF